MSDVSRETNDSMVDLLCVPGGRGEGPGRAGPSALPSAVRGSLTCRSDGYRRFLGCGLNRRQYRAPPTMTPRVTEGGPPLLLLAIGEGRLPVRLPITGRIEVRAARHVVDQPSPERRTARRAAFGPARFRFPIGHGSSTRTIRFDSDTPSTLSQYCHPGLVPGSRPSPDRCPGTSERGTDRGSPVAQERHATRTSPLSLCSRIRRGRSMPSSK